MATGAEDDPVPAYSAVDEVDIFARIEQQAQGLNLPLLASPVDDGLDVDTANRELCADIVDSFFDSVRNRRDELVRRFVSSGIVSPDVVNSKGETPLLAAVHAGNVPMVSVLVALGAEVDKFGKPTGLVPDLPYAAEAPERTPLMFAAQIGNLAMVKVLKEDYGADDAIIAPDGALALRLAAENGHRDVVQFLPTRRGGAWRRWKTSHAREMKVVKRVLHRLKSIVILLVYKIPRIIIWEAPQEFGRFAWARRRRFGGWLKRQITSIPSRISRGSKAVWRGVKALPEVTKEILKALLELVKRIPRAIGICLAWLGNGIQKTASAVANVFMRLFSFLHTLLGVVFTWLGNIRWKDVEDGFLYFLRALFIELPKAIWGFIKSAGATSFKILKVLFGTLGMCVWFIVYGIGWLLLYTPRLILEGIMALFRSIRRAFREILVYFDPKRVSEQPVTK